MPGLSCQLRLASVCKHADRHFGSLTLGQAISYCRRQQVSLLAKPSSNNNKGRRRCQSSSAAAFDIGIAQMAAGGGAWPPQQWAMLTQDTVVCYVDRYDDENQPVPDENFHSLEIEKRIWLLEGNWGDDAPPAAAVGR